MSLGKISPEFCNLKLLKIKILYSFGDDYLHYNKLNGAVNDAKTRLKLLKIGFNTKLFQNINLQKILEVLIKNTIYKNYCENSLI